MLQVAPAEGKSLPARVSGFRHQIADTKTKVERYLPTYLQFAWSDLQVYACTIHILIQANKVPDMFVFNERTFSRLEWAASWAGRDDRYCCCCGLPSRLWLARSTDSSSPAASPSRRGACRPCGRHSGGQTRPLCGWSHPPPPTFLFLAFFLAVTPRLELLHQAVGQVVIDFITLYYCYCCCFPAVSSMVLGGSGLLRTAAWRNLSGYDGER